MTLRLVEPEETPVDECQEVQNAIDALLPLERNSLLSSAVQRAVAAHRELLQTIVVASG